MQSPLSGIVLAFIFHRFNDSLYPGFRRPGENLFQIFIGKIFPQERDYICSFFPAADNISAGQSLIHRGAIGEFDQHSELIAINVHVHILTKKGGR
jgi:hypothetical protein